MKGLTSGQTMRRHVLRNALIPTVAVIAVQVGYLFGGIIAVEKIFNYNGMGQTMLFAAQRKDLPMLTAGVLVIGVVYMVATLIADLTIAWMNRDQLRLTADGPPVTLARRPEPLSPMDPVLPRPRAIASPADRSRSRRFGAGARAGETLRLLARRPAFIIGNLTVLG
jgi:hypothetical protein